MQRWTAIWRSFTEKIIAASGKRPDQVDQMIAGGNARICDGCIGELHKMMNEVAGK
jgi:ATP-dependent protease Clp ATPase subunit